MTCTIDGCSEIGEIRGWCGKHYYRWQRYGDPLVYVRPTPPRRPKPPCKLEWCDRSADSKGLCKAHYMRQKNGADLTAPIGSRQPDRKCTVKGCGNRHSHNGYCDTHATRAGKYGGDPLADVPIQSIFDEIGWGAAHCRVRALWGSAAQYLCIHCDKPASDWSYDGADPTELFGGGTSRNRGMRYSRFPEFYVPACRKCHRTRDGAIQARELEIFRTIMHELRLTAEEVAAKLGVNL